MCWNSNKETLSEKDNIQFFSSVNPYDDAVINCVILQWAVAIDLWEVGHISTSSPLADNGGVFKLQQWDNIDAALLVTMKTRRNRVMQVIATIEAQYETFKQKIAS